MPSIDDAKCVLVTGATAGIGQALALAISQLPSSPKVIGTGRRAERLKELGQQGIDPVYLDLSADVASVQKATDDLLTTNPDLDAVILNAGMQRETNFKGGLDMLKFLEELTVNYISVTAMISRLLPHFLKLSEEGRPCFIIPVSSGLGVVPAPWVAGYSATKAALRSLSTSLRAQLRGSNVHVLEVIPPLVESELHNGEFLLSGKSWPEGTTEKLSKFWMPLAEFTKVTMDGLRAGDSYISAGPSKADFKKFDAPKWESVVEMQKRRGEW